MKLFSVWILVFFLTQNSHSYAEGYDEYSCGGCGAYNPSEVRIVPRRGADQMLLVGVIHGKERHLVSAEYSGSELERLNEILREAKAQGKKVLVSEYRAIVRGSYLEISNEDIDSDTADYRVEGKRVVFDLLTVSGDSIIEIGTTARSLREYQAIYDGILSALTPSSVSSNVSAVVEIDADHPQNMQFQNWMSVSGASISIPVHQLDSNGGVSFQSQSDSLIGASDCQVIARNLNDCSNSSVSIDATCEAAGSNARSKRLKVRVSLSTKLGFDG